MLRSHSNTVYIRRFHGMVSNKWVQFTRMIGFAFESNPVKRIYYTLFIKGMYRYIYKLVNRLYCRNSHLLMSWVAVRAISRLLISHDAYCFSNDIFR